MSCWRELHIALTVIKTENISTQVKFRKVWSLTRGAMAKAAPFCNEQNNVLCIILIVFYNNTQQPKF